jgi:hypothetical protein
MRQINDCSARKAGLTFAVETTAIGPQTLAPITPGQRLQWRADAPLEPARKQRRCDHGLFDLSARNQLDMFQVRRDADDDGRHGHGAVMLSEGRP